jgi:radical SAM protein with 4Fe4S-binding SPASM domain
MIPVTVMVTGKGTVSKRIKGEYGKDLPSRFSDYFRPVIFWNITYNCNLRCKHCYINASPDLTRFEIDTETALRIADEIADMGIPLVIFTGGEPLLRKDFWTIAERLSRRERPKLSLSTNGTLITREVARRLKDLGFSYVGISIDSVKPEVHDSFRGVKGAFERAVKGLENVVSEGIPAGIRTTVTRQNINEVEEVLEFAKEAGASRVAFYVLDTIGRAIDLINQLPTLEQLKRFADSLIDLAKRYERYLEILVVRANFIGIYIADRISRSREDFLKYLRMLGSQGDCGRKTASIYPDGTVRPCQFVDEVIIGDLRKQSLKEILNPKNEKLRPFLEIHNMLRGERCGRCPFRRICGGGSRSRALVLRKDFWGDDPLCIIDVDKLAERWNIKEVV